MQRVGYVTFLLDDSQANTKVRSTLGFCGLESVVAPQCHGDSDSRVISHFMTVALDSPVRPGQRETRITQSPGAVSRVWGVEGGGVGEVGAPSTDSRVAFIRGRETLAREAAQRRRSAYRRGRNNDRSLYHQLRYVKDGVELTKWSVTSRGTDQWTLILLAMVTGGTVTDAQE